MKFNIGKREARLWRHFLFSQFFTQRSSGAFYLKHTDTNVDIWGKAGAFVLSPSVRLQLKAVGRHVDSCNKHKNMATSQAENKREPAAPTKLSEDRKKSDVNTKWWRRKTWTRIHRVWTVSIITFSYLGLCEPRRSVSSCPGGEDGRGRRRVTRPGPPDEHHHVHV